MIVSMPIIDANETNYNDCVHILRTYESWIAEIYKQAGLLDKIPDRENPELVEATAAPGQTYAHINFTDGDKMKDMKIPFAGDQLTRVRFAGAKHIMAHSGTPMDRLEHCSPFQIAMFHTRASLLQYSHHLLHKPDSVNQKGTLKYFREKLNRKNSTPAKVLDSYQGSEELFISMGRAYIITAALDFFGMESLDEKPTLNKFPKNLIHDTLQKKKEYFDKVLGDFVDRFVFQKGAIPESDDFVKNYGLCSIFLTLVLLQLIDTTKEGDGDRNLINQKLLLSIFKSLGAYSKCAIEMFLSIAQIECLLTPRLSEQFKWGFFVNWRGGAGNNIEDDTAQEIMNCISKNIVKRMGPNKTIESISKVCKATSGIKEIIENVDRELNIHKPSSHHTTHDALKDEKEMIKDLQELKPFIHTPGRAHQSFQDIKRTPLLYNNIADFHKWIDTQIQRIYLI